MPRRTLRAITVDGRSFAWRREHKHSRTTATPSCSEVLSIYTENPKRCVQRLTFGDSEEWLIGYPQAGVLYLKGTAEAYNLNRPAVVAALIKTMLLDGWTPGYPYTMRHAEDAYTLLRRSSAPPEGSFPLEEGANARDKS